MKISLYRLSLLVCLAFFAGCNKNTPKEVARTWLTGFNHMDFEQAMKVSTNETKNLLSSLEELTSGVSDSGKAEVKKITVNIKDVKEDGDKAIVTYTSSDNPVEQKLNLVKQDEKWLVMFTKTDLVGVIPPDEDVDTETPVADSSSAPVENRD